MAEQTPRINASYLEQFTHRTVRILGKVTQLRGEEATIDAGGQINVHLNRVCFDFLLFLWLYQALAVLVMTIFSALRPFPPQAISSSHAFQTLNFFTC